jgi:3'-phosphoadenosine 5'-phosphosulfate sulfotransferase (PAPS reductase)/FAD synthetase
MLPEGMQTVWRNGYGRVSVPMGGVKKMSAHTSDDLRQMQSLPLEAKILMSKQRIRQWYDHWDGMVYVSFSGGKDSTVLKHLVENTPGVYDVPSLFVNTGLEYPEIQRFAMSQPNVITVRPEMRFDEVLRLHGYPVISKRVSGYIATAKRNPNSMRAKWIRGEEPTKFVSGGKYTYLIDSPFPISNYCCDAMKKRPAKKYAKESSRHPMTGQMACESVSRENEWRKNGCNGFDMKNPISNPMAFWTEQDVLLYLKKHSVPYCSIYGEIVTVDDDGNEYDMPMDYLEALAAADAMPKLKTTGCGRTGCIFCMFGCHLEKEPNRFQRLKETHPRQYEYCINGGEMVDGKWQPSKDGLGLGKVLDYIGVDYK